jgi:hypothetical protein
MLLILSPSILAPISGVIATNVAVFETVQAAGWLELKMLQPQPDITAVGKAAASKLIMNFDE